MTLSRKLLLPLYGLILILWGGCIRDGDPEGCRRGLILSFYSQSPCQSAPTYPGAIERVALYVFDANDILVESRQSEGIGSLQNYAPELELPSGRYTVVAWAGLDAAALDINALQAGVTRKSDLLFRVRRAAEAVSLQGIRIYQGESPAVTVPAGGSEDIFEAAAINLQEVTNRITVQVDGWVNGPEEYEVVIEADNGSMNIDGTIAADQTIAYPSLTESGNRMMQADFTLLRLDTRHTYTLIMRNSVSGAELYRESLLAQLLLMNPDVNLACDHDFRIRIRVQEQLDGTYAITDVWVNDWLIHSYGTEF